MEGKVGYIKAHGIIMLSCATFVLVVSLYIGASLNTFTGLLLLVLGILFLVNPVIVYNDTGFRTKNAIGRTMREYSLTDGSVEARDESIYVNGRKLRLGKFMLSRSQWNAFYAHVSEKTGSGKGA
jgi:hypothetical protein